MSLALAVEKYIGSQALMLPASFELRKPLGVFTLINMNRLETSKYIDKHQSRVCTNEAVIFKHGVDCHILDKFPYTKTLFFHNCEKNFVYYNLNTKKFPNLEKMYCLAQPSDFSVLHRFAAKPDYTGYLISPYYRQYLNKWWYPTTRHIKEITEENYINTLESFVEVNPSFE